MKRLALALLVAPLPAAAIGPFDQLPEYRDCVARAESAPEQSLAQARAWEEAGGANAARHCAALALLALDRPGEAAAIFADLARELAGAPSLAVALQEQAGNAWLIAGEGDEALYALTRAISLAPTAPELYLARAHAQALTGDFVGVRADLDRAAALAPDLAEIFILRAAAARQLADFPAALADAERAVALAPDRPDALLERANARHLLGQSELAREDWHAVERLAPGTPAAEAAARNLEQLSGR